MTKPWLKVIGILEIAGGASGLAFILLMVANRGVNGLLIWPALIIIGIYVLSVIAGIGLLLGKPFGRITSIIVQAIQLFKIISPQLIFMFSLGVDLYLYFAVAARGMNLGFQFNIFSSYQLYIGVRDAPFGLGISVTALLSLIALIKAKEQNKAEEVLDPLPPPPPPSWE